MTSSPNSAWVFFSVLSIIIHVEKSEASKFKKKGDGYTKPFERWQKIRKATFISGIFNVEN